MGVRSDVICRSLRHTLHHPPTQPGENAQVLVCLVDPRNHVGKTRPVVPLHMLRVDRLGWYVLYDLVVIPQDV